MVLDRDAAAVVDDGEVAVGVEVDLDAARVPGDRLVHRVVDDLGEEVVERVGVGAADIHAGPAPDRLEAFQNLDVGGRVGVARRSVPGGARLGCRGGAEIEGGLIAAARQVTTP